MTDGIVDQEKCAVVGGKIQWHGFGKHYDDGAFITAEQAHDDMNGSFSLYMLPVGVNFNGNEFVNIPKNFAIVRGPTAKDNNKVVFGFATDHYHLIQPIEIIKGFDERVKVSIETLGFINGGKMMFLVWTLPSCYVKEKDEVKLYGSVLFGFDKIFSSRLTIGTIRTLCWNTFNMALEEADREDKKSRGRGTIYSGKHSNPNLLKELLAWMEHIQINANTQVGLINNFFNKLADTPIIHEQQAKDLCLTAFPNPIAPSENMPQELKKQAEEKYQAGVELQTKKRDEICNIFTGSEGIGIDATYWGLFNSCTQAFNYKFPAKKDTEFSILWGNRNKEMNHFADVLRKDIYK